MIKSNNLKIFFLVCCFLTPLEAVSDEIRKKLTSLTFGVVPQQSASKLALYWGPLLQEISRRAGVQLHFRTAPSIPVFEERLNNGLYDLAYMNPYHYIVFHESASYEAFAKAKDRMLQGIIVVKKDSSYQDINSLKGQKLVFPSPAAFAASILTRATFSRLKIPITPVYVGSHDSVYRAIASGRYIAGGGILRTFNVLSPEIQQQLHILTTTKTYTPHAFAYHKRVYKEQIEDILKAFMSLSEDKIGQKLLKPLQLKGVVMAKDEDWNDVRALNIKQLQYFKP